MTRESKNNSLCVSEYTRRHDSVWFSFDFISWCNRMKLGLDVSKTKEVIINCCKKTSALQSMVINDIRRFM